jgi:hypothetical protein
VRNHRHHELIARWIVSGHVGILEAGVMGMLKAVHGDPIVDKYDGKEFWDNKVGRGKSDKVPIMMPPEHHSKVVDFSKLHPDFAFLTDLEKRREFFGRYPFHTILPVIDGARINWDVFVTTHEDYKNKPFDQQVSEPTVCIFFPGGDSAWKEIAALAESELFEIGVTSYNDHNEISPFDLDEFVSYVNRKQKVGFDFIIQDPVARGAQIRSSHTQIRLPLKGEPPEILVIRKGSVSTDRLRAHIGYSIRELGSAKFATHGHDPEIRKTINLDPRVDLYLDKTRLFK